MKRRAAKRVKLRWRVSRGVRRSLGWVPFKAASLKRKGVCVRFCGKHLRVFERVRLEQARWRAHRQAARRIHRKLARCRADSLHKFSRSVVERYQKIVVGDVSSPKLARTHMAKAVLDAGWGRLRTQLLYKGQQAGRSVEVVSERFTTRACSQCGAHSGPQGLRQLVVREWTCADCGTAHDRDVNAAKNILASGNECHATAPPACPWP